MHDFPARFQQRRGKVLVSTLMLMASSREGSLSRSSSALGVGGRLIDALLPKTIAPAHHSQIFFHRQKRWERKFFEKPLIEQFGDQSRVRIKTAEDGIGQLTCFNSGWCALPPLASSPRCCFVSWASSSSFGFGWSASCHLINVLGAADSKTTRQGLMGRIPTRIHGPYSEKNERAWAPRAG